MDRGRRVADVQYDRRPRVPLSHVLGAMMFQAQPDDIQRLIVGRMVSLGLRSATLCARLTHQPAVLHGQRDHQTRSLVFGLFGIPVRSLHRCSLTLPDLRGLLWIGHGFAVRLLLSLSDIRFPPVLPLRREDTLPLLLSCRLPRERSLLVAWLAQRVEALVALSHVRPVLLGITTAPSLPSFSLTSALALTARTFLVRLQVRLRLLGSVVRPEAGFAVVLVTIGARFVAMKLADRFHRAALRASFFTHHPLTVSRYQPQMAQ